MNASELREFVSYDPESGVLIWKKRDRKHFKSDGSFKRFNAVFAGRPTFTERHASGYYCGTVMGRRLLAHRVAWAVHYGEWPRYGVDHINGDPRDNRITNLRDVPQSLNTRNQRRHKDNKSGYTGVYYNDRCGKWSASIQVNYKSRHIGLFKCVTSAAVARRLEEQRNNFHHNHGRMA